MNARERQMLELLKQGRDKFGVAAVKAEFEAEGTRSDEFLRLIEIARRAGVGVGLKIGGAEAIRDLHEARLYGVDYVIAPMVETPYALTKFVAARDKCFTADERLDTKFLFNVETISTYRELGAMADIAGRNGVGMVFGRVDFAGSLGKDRSFCDSAEMTGYVAQVAQAAASAGVELVVGGGVNSGSIAPLEKIRRTRLDRFETRKVIFEAGALDTDIVAGLSLAMDFELLWLQNKRDYYAGIAAEDEARIAMMEARRRAERQTPVRAAA